ncbi:hypothetical protein ACSBR2_027947 [Camellia fascicularis]
MRSINPQIGDGSQEDAHEFLSWVESLEDALTQFTCPEDLDGENMYRCGRCSAYVQARKQLSIHEAPNILTIVLKRFQEGSYRKINKCITFPDMLDMVPFMTGTDDIPLLYLLYYVVVHLDTLNASFSGYYVSYVKDMQGNWFRIDDTVVQSVPMSQEMSEEAYILFYMRSCPRAARPCSGKPAWHQNPRFVKQWASKSQKPSRPTIQTKSSCHIVSLEPPSHVRKVNRNRPPSMDNLYSDATCHDPNPRPSYHTTSSDWSIFTSSYDASFTTESTRDSFSTIDYVDACNADPFTSIFNTIYGSEYSSFHRTISCNMFLSSKSETRSASEGKGFVLDSYFSTQPPDRIQRNSNHCIL